MNSSSKGLLKKARFLFIGLLPFLLLIALEKSSEAIVITGIYTGSCQRKLGVILGVNSYNLKILTQEGKVESFPRYQVVQMITYSVEDMPFSPAAAAHIHFDTVPAFQIATLINLKEKILVTGYPIDFTNEKIAFLTRTGGEVLIDKMSIARIEKIDDFSLDKPIEPTNALNFAHSYSFQSCDKEATSRAFSSIYPNQILSEPLTIKRELDRLQHGFELVDSYLDEQSFYAKPLVYSNKTRLGMWVSTGSRYGKNNSRTNNFTPVLNNEYASDIYGYQRIFSTGSQPNPLFEHEEAQTQALYAFKASYFHFLAYLDPNLILTGSNYSFKLNDVPNGDVRFSSTQGFGLGFDYSNWQVGIVGSALSLSGNIEEILYSDTLGLTKLHLTYTNFLNEFELLVGAGSLAKMNRIDAMGVASSSSVDLDVKHLRLNYYRTFTPAWKSVFSYISNTYNFKNQMASASTYSAKSQSLSAVLSYSFSKRYSTDSMLSVEKYEGGAGSKIYPKIGTSLHLFF